MSKERVGFIGLGTMGKPMSRHLLSAGFPLVVYNRTRSKADELVSLGAVAAESPREVAEASEVVITCLFDDAVVEEAILGKGGVIEGVREGSVVVEMSTISPLTVRRIAWELEARGARMLDAPVTRGSKAAREGTLAIMVGGERDVFERCRPIFLAMGRDLFYMGPIGTGAVAKVVNNILAFVNTLVMVEAMALGVKAGVGAKALYDVITIGSGDSYQVRQRAPHILKGNFDPLFFSMRGAHKDLGVALSLGKELVAPMPMTTLAQQLYQAGKAAGLGELDAGAVVQLYERLMGIQVREEPADRENLACGG